MRKLLYDNNSVASLTEDIVAALHSVGIQVRPQRTWRGIRGALRLPLRIPAHPAGGFITDGECTPPMTSLFYPRPRGAGYSPFVIKLVRGSTEISCIIPIRLQLYCNNSCSTPLILSNYTLYDKKSMLPNWQHTGCAFVTWCYFRHSLSPPARF